MLVGLLKQKWAFRSYLNMLKDGRALCDLEAYSKVWVHILRRRYRQKWYGLLFAQRSLVNMR